MLQDIDVGFKGKVIVGILVSENFSFSVCRSLRHINYRILLIFVTKFKPMMVFK